MNDSSKQFTEKERQGISILVVEPDETSLASLRSTLLGLNIGTVSAVADAHSAKKRMNERKFTHIILSTLVSDISVEHFIPTLLEENEGINIIVASSQPELSQVFDLLVLGARGFVVKPFTEETLDYALAVATKSEPIAPAILKSPDRNKTLVELLMNNLDKVADALRHNKTATATQVELSPLMATLANSVEVAINFADGGEEAYLKKLEEQLIERSRGAATKLGRLRNRLRSKRGHSSKVETDSSEDKSD